MEQDKASDPLREIENEPLHSMEMAPRIATKQQIILLGAGLITLALLLLYLFFSLWPSEFTATTKGSEIQTVHLIATVISFAVSADVRLLIVVMLAGGLGSFIHTATSFGDFVGNEKLTRSWLWWYILKPFIGMTLALVFYLVVRGGFLSAGTTPANINIYGISALAGMVGMFSKQATDKLSEVFNVLFQTSPGSGDSIRKDALTNSLPTLSSVDPSHIEPSTQDIVATLKGTHFVPASTVRINGVNRETLFKSETELTVKILSADVSNVEMLEITVLNPPPNGGVSMPLMIKVAPTSTQSEASTKDEEADEHVDGCNVEVIAATPDEMLPPSYGGVAQS